MVTAFIASVAIAFTGVPAESAPVLSKNLLLSGGLQDTKKEMTFEEEVAELRSYGKTYITGWDLADQQPDDFVLLVREYPKRVEWMKSTYTKYKSDIEAKNEKGQQIQSAAKYAATGFNNFMAQAQNFAEKFNEDYDLHLKNAKDAAADAERNKTPGFYRVSFHQLERCEWMVTILVAFNGDKDETAVKCSKEIDGLQAEYKKKEAALIKATARVIVDPVDKYTGGDRETHRKAILSAWKKAHPTDKVLKVVFPNAAWKMNRNSRWNSATSTWQHTDKSYLVVAVVIQKDAKTATIYPAYVNKENRTGEIIYGVETKGSGFVNDDLPLSKVKV